jgi:NAD(P)-dependent dehydrogenase (short-subunit alcohol dehydrogenase family)
MHALRGSSVRRSPDGSLTLKVVQGKTAFITGGASGIGLGMAHAFVKAGMKVVIADLRQDHIDTALAQFAQHGQASSVHAIQLDVTDRAAMAAAAAEAERVFGKLHVLANNAGIGIQGPFRGITFSDWDFGLAVNLGGVVNGLQTFLPRIRAHGEGGHIVNTASLAALVPMPAQYVIYQTAKAAVVTLSEGIREELAPDNIGVSVLCPGPVRTNIHELSKNRPAQFGVGDAFRAAENAGGTQVNFPSQMEPSEVGERVLAAILNDDLYIITHGEWKSAAERRHAALLAAMPDKLDPRLLAMLQDRN